jgi:hypothetical protein
VIRSAVFAMVSREKAVRVACAPLLAVSPDRLP